jgi:translation initiation factor 1
MKPDKPGHRLVYSTDPESKPEPPPLAASPPPHQQTARLSLDRKGRRGKTVTIVSGLQLAPAELAELSKSLRRLCGAGGTVKDGGIEVQGDHRERIAQALRERGYKVKTVGG